MMWKLMHKILGWDYVQWSNCCDQGVARVHADGMGRAYYWRYTTIGVADIIHKPEQVIWLTCAPTKYMMDLAEEKPEGA